MDRAKVDLHITGTEAHANYEGDKLVLYVIHDRATPERVQDLRHQLEPQLAPKGRFHTFRLMAKHDPNADWS